MLALRRVALRALSSPLPGQAISAPARSIATIRSPSFRQSQLPISARAPLRWLTEEARRTHEDEPTTEAKETTAPLRSEPLSGEASEVQAEDSTSAPNFSGFQPLRSNNIELPPTNTIYVGNLFYDITEADLQREFEKIAPVHKVSIAFDRRGLSKGHGYIEYESVEDAQRAIEQMNQQVFEGRRMIVNFRAPVVAPRPSLRARSNEPTRTLFIGNMSYDMTDQDLNDLFRDIRNVIDVRVAIDRRTGTPKGFAHADFTDIASAEAAAGVLERKRIYGRQLRVDYSQGSKPRGPSRSDSPQQADEPAQDS